MEIRKEFYLSESEHIHYHFVTFHKEVNDISMIRFRVFFTEFLFYFSDNDNT